MLAITALFTGILLASYRAMLPCRYELRAWQHLAAKSK